MIVELFPWWDDRLGRWERYLKLLGKQVYRSLGQVETLRNPLHVECQAISPMVDFVENDREFNP